MSFALNPNKVKLPPLYAMFNDEDLAPVPGARSHAKKKPASYIPRPKNAFIIFRTLFSKWNATLPRVADPNSPDQTVAISDHRSLSKYAGEAWRCMTEDEKAPYKELADGDKAKHKLNYPDYKYSPGERAPTRRTKKAVKAEERSESPPSSVTSDTVDQSLVDDIVTLYQAPRKRSLSCPPPAHTSWGISLPQPFSFPEEPSGSAPVFTNPWGGVVEDPSTIHESLIYPPANTWRRGSRDDFGVSYGQSNAMSGLCNSMGEFTRRVSRYDTTMNSLSSALIPPVEDVWPQMTHRDQPNDFSSNARWDRKKSRDDLDMHIFASNAAISRSRRGQDVRKASIDDIGIQYGYASRAYGWNEAFNSGADLNPLKMTIPAEYHGQSQEPHSALSPISSVASPNSMHEFSPLDAFSPLSPFANHNQRQALPSGYLAMQFDTATPPPLMEIDPSHVVPKLESSASVAPDQYVLYASGSSAEEYNYSEFVHDEDLAQQHQHYASTSREDPLAPEYTSMYQQHGMGILSQS